MDVKTLVLVRKWKSGSFNVCQTLVLVPQSACIWKLALFQQTFAHYINKVYKIIVDIIYIRPHSCFCVDYLCSSVNNQRENIELVSLLFLYTCIVVCETTCGCVMISVEPASRLLQNLHCSSLGLYQE